MSLPIEAEMHHRVGVGRGDVIDQHGVVGRVGRHALVVDDVQLAGALDEAAHRGRLRAGEVVGGPQDRDALDAGLDAVIVQEVGDVFRPDRRNRIGDQRDIGIVDEEAGAGSGGIEQEHLVFLGDRHCDGGEHRAAVGDQHVHFVLRDKLVVQRRRSGGAALIVVADELERDLLVECLHVGAPRRVGLVHPHLQRGMNRHRNARIGTGTGIERADLDFGRRAGGLRQCCPERQHRQQAEQCAAQHYLSPRFVSSSAQSLLRVRAIVS